MKHFIGGAALGWVIGLILGFLMTMRNGKGFSWETKPMLTLMFFCGLAAWGLLP